MEALVVGARLERLSEELSRVERRAYKKLKDVHGLCEVVTPLLQVLRDPPKTSQAVTARHLSALCERNIPAKLVKYSALVLCAAFPLAQLPEQSLQTGALAGRAWFEATALLGHISMLCRTNYSNSGLQGTCQAIMDQIIPSELEEPGRGLQQTEGTRPILTSFGRSVW